MFVLTLSIIIVLLIQVAHGDVCTKTAVVLCVDKQRQQLIYLDNS
jgi:hypothetical protein